MAESTTCRSFLPRFSLRTLLILLTLAGIFVAWQARWMKERREYLRTHPDAAVAYQKDKPVAAPMLMGIWGETGQVGLAVQVPGFGKNAKLYRSNPAPEAAEARKLFPEAIIYVRQGYTLWYTWPPGEKWNWGAK